MKDIESMDNLPLRESMHRAHYKDSWDMKIYDQGLQNYKIVGRYVDRYLSKSIGKNYDKIKKHILERFKDNNTSRNNNNLVETILGWRVGENEKYIIDSQGRIQENKTTKERIQNRINHDRDKRTTFVIIDSERTYKLLDSLTERQIDLLRDVLIENHIMDTKLFNHLINGGIISENKYQDITNGVHPTIKSLDKWKYPNYDYTAQEFVKSCFTIDKDKQTFKLEDKSPEYYQWNKEKQDRKRKEERERDKKREEYNDNILFYLEYKKKEKELAKDIVDRDRLGFDENSFKGEFYHGQKRKNKI